MSNGFETVADRVLEIVRNLSTTPDGDCLVEVGIREVLDRASTEGITEDQANEALNRLHEHSSIILDRSRGTVSHGHTPTAPLG